MELWSRNLLCKAKKYLRRLAWATVTGNPGNVNYLQTENLSHSWIFKYHVKFVLELLIEGKYFSLVFQHLAYSKRLTVWSSRPPSLHRLYIVSSEWIPHDTQTQCQGRLCRKAVQWEGPVDTTLTPCSLNRSFSPSVLVVKVLKILCLDTFRPMFYLAERDVIWVSNPCWSGRSSRSALGSRLSPSKVCLKTVYVTRW